MTQSDIPRPFELQQQSHVDTQCCENFKYFVRKIVVYFVLFCWWWYLVGQDMKVDCLAV
jgi:hypothetical protein